MNNEKNPFGNTLSEVFTPENALNQKNAENRFEASIKKINSSAINVKYKGGQKSLLNTVFVTRMIMLIICASVFMYSVYTIADDMISDMRSRKVMEDITSLDAYRSEVTRLSSFQSITPTLTVQEALGINQIVPPNQIPNPNDMVKYDQHVSVLKNLKEKNSDIYGWLIVSGGMNISYPVVKGKDNDYYLKRDVNKSSSKAGAIFVDCNNADKHGQSYNTIFYGHCMTDGTMFRPIKWWFDNPANQKATADTIKIEVITLDAVYIYEIFSAYRSEGNRFVTYSFGSEKSYVEFLREIKNKSYINRKVNYDSKSRIITFSTCTNITSKPDERYVVHSILKSIIPIN